VWCDNFPQGNFLVGEIESWSFQKLIFLGHPNLHSLMLAALRGASWLWRWSSAAITRRLCRDKSPTSIASNFFDSLWDFYTTFRRRRNLFFRFRHQIFRRRVGILVTSLYAVFFLFKVHVSFSSSQLSIGTRAISSAVLLL